MNDEIKEILEQLEWYRKIGKKDVYYPECVLPNKKAFILLDYITNLQQENLALARENEKEKQFIKDCGFQNQQQLALMYLDYKSRVEKAVEYIKSLCYIESKNEWFTYGDDLSPEHIVNILQNGSEVDYE